MSSAWKIDKQQVDALVNSWINRFDVFAPVRKGDQFAFSQIKTAAEAVLDYDTTILPPKKFFLPQREILFEYAKPGAEAVVPELKTRPRIILGVHTYDLHGLGVLKKVFMGEEQPDPYFTAMDKLTFLVGVDHRDDQYKFSRDMRTDGLDCAYDLFLGKSGDGFILIAGREKGDELLKEAAELVPVDEKELRVYLTQREATLKKIPSKLGADVDEFPVIFPAVQESIIWQQEADKCFSCGSCNLVCPTCYCFDIRDVPDSDTAGGERVRIWDSCMLYVFAKVATGENFREKAYQRLKHRFNRKVWYHRDRYDRSACVGCGRCSRNCKAEINIVKILNKLKEEYNFACSINSDLKK